MFFKKLYRISFPLLLICSLFFFFSCDKKNTHEKVDVYTTIAPYKYFVDFLSDHTLNVKVLVDSDASPHSFEPSSLEIVKLTQADLWLQSGESFENKLNTTLKKSHPELTIHDMRTGLELISSKPCCEHHHQHNHHKETAFQDPHVWLSPKMAKQQVIHLTEVLLTIYPDKEHLFLTKKEKLLTKLDFLDLEIQEALKDNSGDYLLVSHGAFAYFCRDYNLNQLMLESRGGQEPSPRELTSIFETIKDHKIDHIFSQIQYNYKAAKRISEELNLEMIDVDPYSEDYFNNLRIFANNIAKK